ncbi:hypothetical protein CI102_12108 [Trichoderma harzianum]|nr:hypothetical protein CI102_12108 [Trichoderma harzianum]
MTTTPVPGRQWRGKLNDVMYRVQMQRNLRKILEAYRIERWGATADRRPCASGGKSGLASLAARRSSLGGQLTSASCSSEWFTRRTGLVTESAFGSLVLRVSYYCQGSSAKGLRHVLRESIEDQRQKYPQVPEVPNTKASGEIIGKALVRSILPGTEYPYNLGREESGLPGNGRHDLHLGQDARSTQKPKAIAPPCQKGEGVFLHALSSNNKLDAQARKQPTATDPTRQNAASKQLTAKGSLTSCTALRS